MKPLIILLSVFALNTVTLADDTASPRAHCDVEIELQHDVTVSPERLRVFEDEHTLYTMEHDGRLWVDATEIELTEAQTRLVSDYAGEVSAVIPEIVALVRRALEVAGTSLGLAFAEVFGQESSIVGRSENLMASAQRRFDRIVHREGDSYTISRQYISGLDESFGAAFEREVEEMITASMASILALVGHAMVSGEGSFAERMERFGARMDNFGRRMEADMEGIGENLEAAGEEVCDDMIQIVRLEDSLRSEIPALVSYQLFTPEHIRSR